MGCSRGCTEQEDAGTRPWFVALCDGAAGRGHPGPSSDASVFRGETMTQDSAKERICQQRASPSIQTVMSMNVSTCIEVRLTSPRQIVWPPMCACCGEEADTKVEIEFTRRATQIDQVFRYHVSLALFVAFIACQRRQEYGHSFLVSCWSWDLSLASE